MNPGKIREKLFQKTPDVETSEVDTLQGPDGENHGQQTTLQVPDGKSELPQSQASSIQTSGESGVVSQQVEQVQARRRRTGRRQKLLKVPEAKTLSKAGRLAFDNVKMVLDQGVELLQRRDDGPTQTNTEDA